jgi:RNA recognition motif-containing protein
MILSASSRLGHANGRIGQFGLNPVDQSSALFYHDREMDIMEEFVGGRRYEMVELPDSLVETTLFVGNLCEFVTDEMLSAIFQQASSLNFIPAVVCRKPNSSSLKYGFVTFPTVEEKELAIIRFSGYLLNNRPMKVEAIVDYKYRVRVPEQLVQYTVGESKKTRDGSRNTMRVVQNASREPEKSVRDKRRKNKFSNRASSASRTSETTSSSYDRNKGKKKRMERRKARKRRDKFDGKLWM